MMARVDEPASLWKRAKTIDRHSAVLRQERVRKVVEHGGAPGSEITSPMDRFHGGRVPWQRKTSSAISKVVRMHFDAIASSALVKRQARQCPAH